MYMQGPPGRRASGGNGSGNGNDIHGRVSALEAQLQHLATKNDITGLKVWIFGGVLSAIVIAATMSAIVVKAFF